MEKRPHSSSAVCGIPQAHDPPRFSAATKRIMYQTEMIVDDGVSAAGVSTVSFALQRGFESSRLEGELIAQAYEQLVPAIRAGGNRGTERRLASAASNGDAHGQERQEHLASA